MEVIPFLITAIITVFSIAFGTIFYNVLWYLYGKLELGEKAVVTTPICINNEYHHYVKIPVRNKTMKAFVEVRPILKLKGEGRADYITDRPYYEVETEGELCWGGSESCIKTIYPYNRGI